VEVVHKVAEVVRKEVQVVRQRAQRRVVREAVTNNFSL